MNQERFKQIDSILDEVLEVSTVERERILDERCREDSELKREVLQLLSSLDDADDFIENSAFTPVKHFIENETDEFIGKKIGAYRLKKLLGAGGMSAVYLASRIDDFEKEVAVKIIPPFENRKQSAENFRRERQILARLEHPNIAQILDGGTTEGEKPYIVMEYVDGFPLNVFCDENSLDETEKLKIFQEVCHTVSFAHQNLIVHRDLKPNNIFVTKNGKVKLLDFGIAKLLDAEGFNFTENKTFDGNALTLEYASPEQINGENITVASDVYSLGVILYELLTGKRPHDFKNKSLNEILKIVENEEPIAPSAIQDSRFKIQNSKLETLNLESKILNPVICVPSGNFGNICAGILAHISGLPCEKFIAATNANDVIPNFLNTGKMETKSSVATLSNAMDVANPSNFVRILEIFDNDFLNLRGKMESVSVSDETTAETMREVYAKYDYVLDPHGAVGFYALEKYLEKNPDQKGFFLETAHPIKFDSVEQILGTYGETPESVKDLFEKPKQSVEMQAYYEDLRELLLEKI